MFRQGSSFLEMLDVLSEQQVANGEEPVAFDHDCREGICGSCSLDDQRYPARPRKRHHRLSVAHAPLPRWPDHHESSHGVPAPFPVIKDLVTDRTAFDRIIQSGGFITARAGTAVDANSSPIAKGTADYAMDAAACIGCGACVAACPNASAMLFTAAKVSHLNSLPQGKPEKDRRALAMVSTMDGEGFGGCTNIGECEAAVPEEHLAGYDCTA